MNRSYSGPYIDVILFSFLFLLPFWAVIDAQVAYYFGVDSALLKYIYLLLIISLFLFLWAIRLKVPAYSLSFIALCLWVLYLALHIFRGTNSVLKLNGVLHEWIYAVFALLLLLSVFSVHYSSSLVQRIMFLKYNIVLAFAVYQFFDYDIATIIYRDSIEGIGNLKLAVGYRLVSLMVNPINFATFIIIGYGAASSLIKNNFVWGVYSALSLVMILYSYSRLALLCFSVVLFFTLYFRMRGGKYNLPIVLPILFVVSLPLIYLFLSGSSGLAHRVTSLFELETYLNNARFVNWLGVFGQLSLSEWFFGLGLGYSSPSDLYGETYGAIKVENSIVSILVQYGVVGCLLFFCILIVYFFNLRKIRYSFPDHYYFYSVFFITWLVMSIGNDFQRNLPFVFYFWFSYVAIWNISRMKMRNYE